MSIESVDTNQSLTLPVEFRQETLSAKSPPVSHSTDLQFVNSSGVEKAKGGLKSCT